MAAKCMRPAERFDARAVAWFLRILGVALVADVAAEISAGVWGVHTGALYPWRHIDIIPLYPERGLAIEWTLRALAGAALLYYLYKHHVEQNGQKVQYYKSQKNGRVYYRDPKTHQAHYVTEADYAKFMTAINSRKITVASEPSA